MSTTRLNHRDRLYIRIANDGTAVASSAMWRSKKPSKSEGRFRDITSCVVGCCSTEAPTEQSFIVFRATSLNAQSNITTISFPGYEWTGELGNGEMLVVPLPYNFSETITVTTLVESADMSVAVSTTQGTGVITGDTIVVADADPQTFELVVDSAIASQYLVLLTDD